MENKINLHAHEQAGGHTLARHVGKSSAWLQSRLLNEPMIPMASSFADVITAEMYIDAALQANAGSMASWLHNNSPRVQSFDYDAGLNVGYGYVRGFPAPQLMRKLRVVVRLSVGPTKPYVVLTAFPIV